MSTTKKKHRMVFPKRVSSDVARIAYPKPRKTRRAIVSKTVGRPPKPAQSVVDWRKILKGVGYSVGIVNSWPNLFKDGSHLTGPFPTEDDAWKEARRIAIRTGAVKVKI